MTMFKKPERHVDRVFLHCSASDDESLSGNRLVEEVCAWHRARGFSDVGYHFLIDKHGDVLPGRDIEKTPAAQKGHNTGTIAVMVHGLEDFPQPMLNACRDFCGAINEACEGRITFHGHCEVSAKTCPVFDYTALLGLDRFGRMPARE
ncbi:MAG: N-acetylmuramoyl-L-alanine amidase [Alphaproteobacteria bacterium]|nr:N-acetylmuramoyl-L-alanine amidase [Alphaproteobacteria bacterium]